MTNFKFIMHGVRITRYIGSKGHFGKAPSNQKLYFNTGFTMEQLTKWKWYFHYITSKWQLETPRQFVELEFFTYEATPVDEAKIKKNLATAAKARVTKIANKIEQYKQWYASQGFIWPMEEQKDYQAALCKLREAEQVLRSYQQ